MFDQESIDKGAPISSSLPLFFPFSLASSRSRQPFSIKPVSDLIEYRLSPTRTRSAVADYSNFSSSSYAFSLDFEDYSVNNYGYSLGDIGSDWNSPSSVLGSEEQRAFIVSTERNGSALKVVYPAEAFSSADSGAQWKLDFGQSFSFMRLEYKLKFSPGFDFSRGGKLPGFYGGAGNSGGDKPSVDGSDGFSARIMWRRRPIDGYLIEGAAEQYVYHPGQESAFGDSFYWSSRNNKPFVFEDDRWYTISTEIKMNSQGQSDGFLVSYVDNKKVLELNDFFFGDPDIIGIDGFYFSTFFGGGDNSWSPDQTQFALFDDFLITDRSKRSNSLLAQYSLIENAPLASFPSDLSDLSSVAVPSASGESSLFSPHSFFDLHQ